MEKQLFVFLNAAQEIDPLVTGNSYALPKGALISSAIAFQTVGGITNRDGNADGTRTPLSSRLVVDPVPRVGVTKDGMRIQGRLESLDPRTVVLEVAPGISQTVTDYSTISVTRHTQPTLQIVGSPWNSRDWNSRDRSKSSRDNVRTPSGVCVSFVRAGITWQPIYCIYLNDEGGIGSIELLASVHNGTSSTINCKAVWAVPSSIPLPEAEPSYSMSSSPVGFGDDDEENVHIRSRSLMSRAATMAPETVSSGAQRFAGNISPVRATAKRPMPRSRLSPVQERLSFRSAEPTMLNGGDGSADISMAAAGGARPADDDDDDGASETGIPRYSMGPLLLSPSSFVTVPLRRWVLPDKQVQAYYYRLQPCGNNDSLRPYSMSSATGERSCGSCARLGYRFAVDDYLPPGEANVLNGEMLYMGTTRIGATIGGEPVDIVLSPSTVVNIDVHCEKRTTYVPMVDDQTSEQDTRSTHDTDDDYSSALVRRRRRPQAIKRIGGDGTSDVPVARVISQLQFSGTVRNSTDRQALVVLSFELPPDVSAIISSTPPIRRRHRNTVEWNDIFSPGLTRLRISLRLDEGPRAV